MKSIGIDLAGKEKNPTGVSILEDNFITSHIYRSNEGIVSVCESERPDIIAIDAPLSKPREKGLRECDSKLIEKGYRVLPPLMGGMRPLTERGIRLAEDLRKRDFEVIEVHPLTSGKVLFDTSTKEEWISKLSERGWDIDRGMNYHEIDSTLAAITGFLHLNGNTEEVKGGDGEIVIPRDFLPNL